MPAAMVRVQEQYALLFFGKERAPSESVLGVRAVPLDRVFWWRKSGNKGLLASFYRLVGSQSEAHSDLPNSFSRQ
jgi:hypothetical protein